MREWRGEGVEERRWTMKFTSQWSLAGTGNRSRGSTGEECGGERGGGGGGGSQALENGPQSRQEGHHAGRRRGLEGGAIESGILARGCAFLRGSTREGHTLDGLLLTCCETLDPWCALQLSKFKVQTSSAHVPSYRVASFPVSRACGGVRGLGTRRYQISNTQ